METGTSTPWEHVQTPMTPLEMPSSPASDVHDSPVQPPLETHINVVSPYTPAPSPQPFIQPSDQQQILSPFRTSQSKSRSDSSDSNEADSLYSIRTSFASLDSNDRKRILADLLSLCDIDQLVFVSNLIAPRLKRDFLRELPVEIALHILSFIDDPRTLTRASCVSRFWRNLLGDEYTWKTMCLKHNFGKSMRDAYRSALEGNMSWEAKQVMTSASTTPDALATAMEATTMADDTKMSLDTDSDTDRTMTSTSATDGEIERRSIVSSFFPGSSRSFAAGSALPTLHRPNAPGTSRLSLKPSIDTRRALMPTLTSLKAQTLRLPAKLEEFSFKKYFKLAYLTEANWRRGGRVLKSHTSADDGVVTSVAMNDEWIVAGLVNHRIHVFAADTGAHVRTLVGHTQGVWCLVLVSKGGSPSAATRVPESTKPYGQSTFTKRGLSRSSASSSADEDTPPSIFGAPGSVASADEDSVPLFGPHLRQSDVCNTSVGWGQSTSLVVSGGCDRDLRVWDVATGYCLHSLKGHTSTVRCLKVLDGRPIAVTGSRDSTLRVWDIQKGRCLHLLSGHTNSVRCLDVAGNIAVSGSYDCTARLWNVDTGECLRVFEGHYHQIYAVAFDGMRVATGSLDSTVRVWSAETGTCTALLQGHTSLVGQLQLSGDTLISGGSDGRVIIFSLKTSETRYRLCAHDNSVTCLQFDDRFLITGGNDGHVKLFEVETGTPIRELTEPCEAVWRVGFRKDKCVIMCKRAGKTVMEILSFRPPEDAL
ncbi:hypothetical protein FRB99_008431 [Tulasnella sp. 403]|nr:hypothetical protein FRB99_008431 [Tulasnella sp. 403]